jgi:phosphatidylethanolamine N-methyltransferase
MGMWVPVHDDQWDGDVPVLRDQPALEDHGEVVFQKDQLPWQVGKYEVSWLSFCLSPTVERMWI